MFQLFTKYCAGHLGLPQRPLSNSRGNSKTMPANGPTYCSRSSQCCPGATQQSNSEQYEKWPAHICTPPTCLLLGSGQRLLERDPASAGSRQNRIGSRLLRLIEGLLVGRRKHARGIRLATALFVRQSLLQDINRHLV